MRDEFDFARRSNNNAMQGRQHDNIAMQPASPTCTLCKWNTNTGSHMSAVEQLRSLAPCCRGWVQVQRLLWWHERMVTGESEREEQVGNGGV